MLSTTIRRDSFCSRWLAADITKGSARHEGLCNVDDRLATSRLPFPATIAEQQKIADCLTSLDELIAAQGRKVEALKAHKRGLMQQLFPAKAKPSPASASPSSATGRSGEDARRLGDTQLGERSPDATDAKARYSADDRRCRDRARLDRRERSISITQRRFVRRIAVVRTICIRRDDHGLRRSARRDSGSAANRRVHASDASDLRMLSRCSICDCTSCTEAMELATKQWLPSSADQDNRAWPVRSLKFRIRVPSASTSSSESPTASPRSTPRSPPQSRKARRPAGPTRRASCSSCSRRRRRLSHDAADVRSPICPTLAQHLREELQTKKFVLLYAYNGTGKTRLSTEFKDLGKKRRRRATRSTSTPSPKTCSTGTTISRTTASGC